MLYGWAQRRRTRLADWHAWFAWYPVKITQGAYYGWTAWLHWVHRRRFCDDACQVHWQYRIAPLQPSRLA